MAAARGSVPRRGWPGRSNGCSSFLIKDLCVTTSCADAGMREGLAIGEGRVADGQNLWAENVRRASPKLLVLRPCVWSRLKALEAFELLRAIFQNSRGQPAGFVYVANARFLVMGEEVVLVGNFFDGDAWAGALVRWRRSRKESVV